MFCLSDTVTHLCSLILPMMAGSANAFLMGTEKFVGYSIPAKEDPLQALTEPALICRIKLGVT